MVQPSAPASKPAQQPFNYDLRIKETNNLFGQVVKELSPRNVKGTERYAAEVEFAYTLHEFKEGPPYLKSKLYESANAQLNALIAKTGFKRGPRQEA